MLPARWYKETLEPLSDDARIVARFDDGSPAAVMGTYGKGPTLMLGSYVSAAYQSTPTPETAQFFASLVEWAGVTLPLEVSGAPLEARHLESGSDALLCLFNHGGEAAQSKVAFRRPAGDYTATDLVNGRTVAVARTAEGVTIGVELESGAVRVLRISGQ